MPAPSSEDALKKWINGDRVRDLVVSAELVKGYEHSIVIDTKATFDLWSRCSSKLINLYQNNLLDMLHVYQNILKSTDHNCDEMMALSEDYVDMIDSSPLDMLGEYLIPF